jgi:hypothetical protein
MTKDSERQSPDPSKELVQQLKEATGAVKSLDETMREATAAIENRGEQKELGNELQAAREGPEKQRTLGDALKDFGKFALDALYSGEMKSFVGHGSHEIANMLFNGSGFVMYPRGSHDNGPEKGQENEPEKQHERGGIGM